MASAVLALATVVTQWTVFEVPMTAQTGFANAYRDGLPDGGPPLVTVTFKNGRREYQIAGFWDGGKTWKARFAPPSPGRWSYESRSRDPGLAGVRGEFECRAASEAEKAYNAALRGFIRVSGRHFEYADGTPFLWIGDTWWAWGRKGIPFERFARVVDDRAAKGFTIGQMLFSGRGWLLDDRREMPDLKQIHKVEKFIEYANARGLVVWIHAWWGGKDLAANVGPEKIRRWWRYVIHRLGAYNVVWVIAAEYNTDNYGGLGADFWKDLGARIKREDPYGRIVSAHPTPPGWRGGAEAPQWSTGSVLHREKWLDYNQSQVGHGKWRNEMIPLIVAKDYRRKPAKPVVVTEPWYEFVRDNPPAADVRFGAWSAILSGAAGHSYGGGHIWWAHVPEAPSRQEPWPLEPFEVNTLDYPGAVSIGFLARFLRSMEWWKLEPHPELVSENPSRYCAAIPGREYVVYLRWGGAVRVELPSGSFRYTWTDLTESAERAHGAVDGGGRREFHAPEDYPWQPRQKDWLLHVRRIR